MSLAEPKTKQSEAVGVEELQPCPVEDETKTLTLKKINTQQRDEKGESTQREKTPRYLSTKKKKKKPFMDSPVTSRALSHWLGRCRRGGALRSRMRVKEAGGSCGPRRGGEYAERGTLKQFKVTLCS